MTMFSAKNSAGLWSAARAARAQNALVNRRSEKSGETFRDGRLLSISVAPVLAILAVIAFAA